MKYEELIKNIKEAIAEFNEKTEGPDSFIESFLKSVNAIFNIEN